MIEATTVLVIASLLACIGFVIGFSVGFVVDKKQQKDIFGPRDRDC